MKLKKLHQKGFTHLEVALIIVVLLTIGVAGVYVFKKSKNNEQPTQTPETPEVTKTETTPQTQTSTQKYLEIPELGIKMPLDNTIADAYYYIRPGYPSYAYLSVRSLEKTGVCAADKTSLGVLAKGGLREEYNPGFTYQDAVSAQSGKVIGDYAYVYTHPQATCVDGASTTEQNAQLGSIIQAFNSASKNIEARE